MIWPDQPSPIDPVIYANKYLNTYHEEWFNAGLREDDRRSVLFDIAGEMKRRHSRTLQLQIIIRHCHREYLCNTWRIVLHQLRLIRVSDKTRVIFYYACWNKSNWRLYYYCAAIGWINMRIIFIRCGPGSRHCVYYCSICRWHLTVYGWRWYAHVQRLSNYYICQRRASFECLLQIIILWNYIF